MPATPRLASTASDERAVPLSSAPPDGHRWRHRPVGVAQLGRLCPQAIPYGIAACTSLFAARRTSSSASRAERGPESSTRFDPKEDSTLLTMKSLCNLVDPARGKKPIPSTPASPAVSRSFGRSAPRAKSIREPPAANTASSQRCQSSCALWGAVSGRYPNALYRRRQASRRARSGAATWREHRPDLQPSVLPAIAEVRDVI